MLMDKNPLIVNNIINDKELVETAILTKSEDQGKYLSLVLSKGSKLNFDKSFILKLVEIDGCNLKYIPNLFKNDLEIVEKATESNDQALYYVGDDFIKNPEPIFKLDPFLHRMFKSDALGTNLEEIRKIFISKISESFEPIYLIEKTFLDKQKWFNFIYVHQVDVNNHKNKKEALDEFLIFLTKTISIFKESTLHKLKNDLQNFYGHPFFKEDYLLKAISFIIDKKLNERDLKFRIESINQNFNKFNPKNRKYSI
jgi:hypothetical protein